MKTHTILFAALLATSFMTPAVLSGDAFAQTAPAKKEVVTNTTTRTVRPLAIDGNTKELKPAIQRFVERVNMARYSLSMKKPQDALVNIDEAQKHAAFIKENSRVEEIKEKVTIASGRVTSDTTDSFNSYYVPLEEGPVVVKSLEATESQTGKTAMSGVAVKSVDLVYLNVDLAGETAPKYLEKARAEIKAGDLKAADKTLGEMIDKVATTEVVDALPMTKASDNLRLSLKFLQDENYTAARYALEQARSALKEAQGNPQYNHDDVTSLHGKVSQIHDLVMQETEQAAQKARTQIIAVQKTIDGMKS